MDSSIGKPNFHLDGHMNKATASLAGRRLRLHTTLNKEAHAMLVAVLVTLWACSIAIFWWRHHEAKYNFVPAEAESKAS